MSAPADPLVDALERLLAESAAHWKLGAEVRAAEDGQGIVVAGSGRRLIVRRLGEGPARWALDGHGEASRPCASVSGVLRAVREAFDADPGHVSRLRLGAPGVEGQ